MITSEQHKRILTNLPLVSINLKQIVAVMANRPTFLEWNDLEQAGREGLIKAVLEEETKPDNVRWTTFAHWNIRGAIRDALEGNENKAGERQVRLPHRIHVAMNAVTKANSHLLQVLKRDPLPDEIAKYLNISESAVLILMQWNSQNPESSDWLQEDDDGNTVADVGQNVFEHNEDDITDPIVLQTLREVMSSPMLAQREVEILLRNVVGDESFEDIGQSLQISRQRVQQIQARAMAKVKQDSRMRRHENEDLFVPNMRTAHLYRYANRDRSDEEWWAENTVKLEWTDERRRAWEFGSIPRSILN